MCCQIGPGPEPTIILSLLRPCLDSIGVQGAWRHPYSSRQRSRPGRTLDFLDAAEQGRVDNSIAFVPAARYAALRMAATRARSSIPRSQPPPPLPQSSNSAAAARPRLPLNVELWSFDGHICKAFWPSGPGSSSPLVPGSGSQTVSRAIRQYSTLSHRLLVAPAVSTLRCLPRLTDSWHV